MKLKNTIQIATVFLLLVGTMQFANAFAIASPCLDEERPDCFWQGSASLDAHPLVIYPGQSKQLYYTLQNLVGDNDVRLQAEIIGGSEIATLTDSNTEYSIPLGVNDVRANFKVEVSDDAQIGTEYIVTASFTQTSSGDGGMVQFAGVIQKSFPVVVGGEPPKEPGFLMKWLWLWLPLLLLVLIAVTILIIYVVKHRSNVPQLPTTLDKPKIRK